MAFDTPSRPRPWTTPARRSARDLGVGEPQRWFPPRQPAPTRPGRAPACRATSGRRSRRRPAARRRTGLGQAHPEGRFGPDHRRPRSPRRPGRRGSASHSHRRSPARSGSNWEPARFSARATAGPTPPMRWATSVNSPIWANREAIGMSCSLQVAGPALAVPLLVGCADRGLHGLRTARVVPPAPGPGRRAGRSCRRGRGDPTRRTPRRPGSGAAAGCRCRPVRSMASTRRRRYPVRGRTCRT